MDTCHLRTLALTLFVLAASSVSKAWAQSPSLPADRVQVDAQAEPVSSVRSAPRDREVLVQLIGSTAPVKGRLVELDGTQVVIRLPSPADAPTAQPATVTYLLERVRHIDDAKADSVIEGAILGALYLAACARWWCHQGGEGEGSDLPKDVLLGAAFGAAVGARIDAAFVHHNRIYEAPAPRRSTALAPATLGVVFTF